jgi:hypothetical protein
MANINIGGTTFIRTDEQEAREEAFIRTFVSKYFLPGKLSKAKRSGAQKVLVPLETLEALIARVDAARFAGKQGVRVGVDTIEGLLAEAGVY